MNIVLIFLNVASNPFLRPPAPSVGECNSSCFLNGCEYAFYGQEVLYRWNNTMQTTFYKTALTLDHKHPILIDNPVALCHVFFGGFVVALTCVALWRGHMRCRMLTSFLLTACHNLSYRHAEMHEQLLRSCQLRQSLSMCRL